MTDKKFGDISGLHTTQFRLAIRRYCQYIQGYMYEDYDYEGQMNKFLSKQIK